jgi:alginate O-acetyltransferase complex protein AlgJ
MLYKLAEYSKFLLPICFFGYAAVANVGLLFQLSDKSDELKLADLSFIKGEMAGALNDFYKSNLLHREPSIDIVGAARYLTLDTGRDGIVVGKDGWFFTKEEFETSLDADQSLAFTLDKISEFKTQLAERNMELIVVPLPAKSDIYPEQLSTFQQASAVSDRYFEFIEGLKEIGVASISSRDALLESKSNDLVFLKSDTHWSPFGAGEVAKEIAMSLPIEDYGIAPSDFELAKSGEISFWGDLTTFITSENLAPYVGLDQESAELFVAETKAEDDVSDLFGDDTQYDVVLIGTSYSANENWSFAEQLKAELSSDVLNLSEEGKGPVTPMLNYINGDLINEYETKLVIWEFPVRYIGQDILWAEFKDESLDKDKVAQVIAPNLKEHEDG